MGLIAECEGVFRFFNAFFSVLPKAIQMLVLGSFGGFLYIAVMKMFRG